MGLSWIALTMQWHCHDPATGYQDPALATIVLQWAIMGLHDTAMMGMLRIAMAFMTLP